MNLPTIREVQGEELLTHFVPLNRYAFYASPPVNAEQDYERFRAGFVERLTLCLFEGERAVASCVGIPMTQHIRGKILPMVGIAGVITLPEARRKGYSRQVIHETLRQMYERGNVVSTLYPFRESYYGRMGYVMLSQIRRWKCRTADLAQLIQQDFPGSVEMSHIRDQWEIFNRYLDERQQVTHGLGLFPQSIRDWQRGMLEQWIVIARDQDGEVIGAMPYRISGFRERFEVPSLFSSNPLGRYLLLQWAARHVDQTTEFDVKLAPYERPETWLADLEMRSDPDIWITPLGRVLDVRGLSGIGAGDGEITVQIHDGSCAWNNLTVHLTGSGGKLDVTAVSQPAELELTINGLSALVYGTNDPDDFQWRGWGNPAPAQAATLRRMFPIAQPWLYSLF